ncbi:dsRBD fold-containing protein [Pseudonocardia lutea]|jgi:hypothetical protein|uniref:DsRBD fold-containing protein n=1 Tax=Pseudonocardia lutea TaxID=2172015 RepID=A0ABW1IDX1_9PSEU
MTEPTTARSLSDALTAADRIRSGPQPDRPSGIPAGKRWTVIVDLEAGSGVTRAVARLHDRVSDRLVGIGQARLAPPDADVPGVADEVAAAQALVDLARHMLEVAHAEVETATPAVPH